VAAVTRRTRAFTWRTDELPVACQVRGCERAADWIRIRHLRAEQTSGQQGVKVGYCLPHYQEAVELFDRRAVA
jgi:hypothetical protein